MKYTEDVQQDVGLMGYPEIVEGFRSNYWMCKYKYDATYCVKSNACQTYITERKHCFNLINLLVWSESQKGSYLNQIVGLG